MAEQDFGEYMESLNSAQEKAERMEELYRKHEIWRETTWGGWVTRSLQSFAQTFIKPFIRKVSELMNDNEKLGNRLQLFLLRLFVILLIMGFVIAISKLFDRYMGNIVKEEEIVIVHEYDTQEEADKARAAADKARAAAGRGKRSKQPRKEE